MRRVLPDDYGEIRDAMQGVIDFVPTNEQIDTVLDKAPELMGLGIAWGWSDTETRDQMAKSLEDLQSGERT